MNTKMFCSLINSNKNAIRGYNFYSWVILAKFCKAKFFTQVGRCSMPFSGVCL